MNEKTLHSERLKLEAMNIPPMTNQIFLSCANFLNLAELPKCQRQDSTASQISDLVLLARSLGMIKVVEHVCQRSSFPLSLEPDGLYVANALQIIEVHKLKISKASLAQEKVNLRKLAIAFKCYDADDWLKKIV